MGSGQPQLSAEPGGGGHPLQGPTEALEDACGDMGLLVAWPPLREAHLFVAHGQGAGTVAQQQQQQPQALPPPPPPPPPPPQQQQTQPAATGAGETGGGGAGGSRPNAVRFSRNHVPAARGGGERGNGGNN